MEPIGLIAGNRDFPVLFMAEALKRSVPVAAVCIKGETDRRIPRMASSHTWLSLTDYEKGFDFFRSKGVKQVVMAGQISPFRLFSREVRNHPATRRLLESVRDKRANTIFAEIARLLGEQGFGILSSVTFLEDHVPGRSVLTPRKPTDDEQDNIAFAFTMAKAVAGLDIGLSVAVKSKVVVAVEAFEGTDRLIRRAGALAGKGFVVAKVGRQGQDMRFDIPVIGMGTVRSLAAAGASCLAIEAGTTLLLDKEKALAYASRKKISIVAV